MASAQVPARPNDLGEVLEHSADGVVQADPTGRVTFLNPAALRMLGLDAGMARMPLQVAQLAATGTRRQLLHTVLPALQVRGVWLGEIRLRLGARRRVPFSLMALAHRDADGRVLRYSAVLRDISADVQARQQIQRQHDILSAITHALPATVVIVDAQGRYRFVNNAFERYVGLPADQIIGRTAVDVLGPEEVARRRPYMQRAVAGEAVDFTLDYPGDQGTTYLALNCIPLRLDGMVDGFVGISQDITVQRREQARLAQLATRDPLTGLLNRAGFEQGAAQRRVDNQRHALLYIDLDHFKPVNDSLGHQAGDQVLQQFAARLSAAVRSTDLVARLGGDEFAVLLAGAASLAAAELVADKVLAAAALPFDIDGQAVQVGASIGVAVMAHDAMGLPELMAQADRELYRAKAGGRGRWVSQVPWQLPGPVQDTVPAPVQPCVAEPA
jgi:diguanylate cyclase (GGDEF)-like protein/PAS domain S-box-containing protein